MEKENKNFNEVLNEELNLEKSTYFENEGVRQIIKMANKSTKILRHLIMDYSIIQDDKLIVIDAKNYNDTSNAFSNAKKSLEKIKHQDDDINLKVLTTDDSKPEYIKYDSTAKDSSFINLPISVDKNCVEDLKTYINFIFSSENRSQSFKLWINKLDEYKDELRKLNKREKSKFDKEFINIYKLNKLIIEKNEESIDYLKSKLLKGDFSYNDFRRKRITDIFEVKGEYED